MSVHTESKGPVLVVTIDRPEVRNAVAALEAAAELAIDIARFPQAVMRADRRSALGQWGSTTREAMAQEFAGGIAAAAGGETQMGAKRFAAGHGRHGDFEDI